MAVMFASARRRAWWLVSLVYALARDVLQRQHSREQGLSALLLISLGLVHALARPAPAQNAAPPAEAGEAATLAPLTVSAERILPFAGAGGTVVSARLAREHHAKDVAEILKTEVPGVTGKRIGGMHLDPIIRGLREDRLSVMTNGTKIWGGGPFRMDPPTSLLEIEDIEAIEVIKGPYSVTRGPSGIGGTINLVTKQPELAAEWYASGSLGSLYASNYKGFAGLASVSAGGPRLAFRLSGSYRDYQDYDSGDDEQIQSGFQSQSVSGALLWQPHAAHRFHLSLSRESDRDSRFATLPLHLEEDDAYLGSLTYTFTEPLPSVHSLSLTGYYNYVHHRMNNEHKPSRVMLSNTLPLDARTFGGRLKATLGPAWGGRLTVGGDAYRLEREGTHRIRFRLGPNAGRRVSFATWPETSIMDGGIFIEYDYRLAAKWRLIVGARVDFVSTTADPDATTQLRYRSNTPAGADTDDIDSFETNVSANGRLIYSPLPTLDLFVGLGRAVRTADATERYLAFGPGPGGFYVGNPALDPEESLEVDVGLNAGWGRLAVDGSFFYNRVDDYILPHVIDPERANPVRTFLPMAPGTTILRGFRNIDHASLVGVELGLSYVLREDLSLVGTFAYVRGENEQDNTALPEIPPLEGRLGLRYEHPDWGLWLNPTVRLAQSQHRIDTAFGEDVTPGFVTVDLNAGWRALGPYELIIAVDNLLNTTYHEHTTRENPFSGREVFEAGRVVTVGIRASF